MKPESAFPARLYALRLQAGLSQSELARRIALSRNQYRNIEGGVCTPSWSTVEKLADELKVSTDAFR